jgi:arsenite/tail-anchored protein-transporting ATPase
MRSATWPEAKHPLSIAIGKGGVGKTTIAAAIGYKTAKTGAEVLICSVDPAPSLDDVFAQKIGEDPVSVAGLKNLNACELDSGEEYRRWAVPLRARVDRAFHAERSGVHIELAFEREMFSSLLDIVPPGVDELFAVLRVSDLATAGTRQLILDMAPTGHALELLRTPERMLHWGRLLMKSLAPHRKLPLAQEIAVEIASITQRVRALRDILDADSERWAVMLAEPLPDRETERLFKGLVELSLAPTATFINRVLIDEIDCPRCNRARAWQARTLSRWQRRSDTPVYVVPEFTDEIAGRSRLERFIRRIYAVETDS